MKSIHLSETELATVGRALQAFEPGAEDAEQVRSVLAKLAEATDDEITEASLLIG